MPVSAEAVQVVQARYYCEAVQDEASGQECGQEVAPTGNTYGHPGRPKAYEHRCPEGHPVVLDRIYPCLMPAREVA